jgi:hypothetical protein
LENDEWLACSQPVYMAAAVPFSSRKHRLFAVACCRQVAYLLHDETLQAAIEIAERFADQTCTETERAECERRVQRVFQELKELDPGTKSIVMRGDFVYPETYAAEMMTYCLSPDAKSAATHVPFAAAAAFAGTPYEDDLQFEGAFATQADLVRCIFGNPTRPINFDSRWRTSVALSLAREMYEERDFRRLPLLADALMEAGCNDEQVVSHCKLSGMHVRGCWVLDFVLGKA